MSKRKPARTIKAQSASKIRSKAAGSGQPTGRANSKQARVLARGLPVGLSYSFDMLLPIIKLRDAHYQIDLAGPRYYFYVHKVAGFVLASFLIAGISGLTK